MWRSLVARFVRDEEVVGSNPATPTSNHGASDTFGGVPSADGATTVREDAIHGHRARVIVPGGAGFSTLSGVQLAVTP